jgi:hypothetical protein
VVALYKDTGVTDEADPATLLRIATSLRQVGKEAEGLSLMEHGVASHSESAPMYMALGDFYTQIGKPEQAAAATQRGRQLSISN